MMERRRYPPLCTSVISLRVALEHVENTDTIAVPAWLARKLLSDADALKKANAPLWFALALLAAAILTVGISRCHVERDPSHEPAHRGEIL
jgi:hypothetical protein